MTYTHLDRRVSKTVLAIIENMCADYPRRKRLVECQFRTRTTDEEVKELRKINDTIDTALESVDEGLRQYILSDIANRNGYGRSMASPYIRKDTYYKQKNEAILRMALLFHLVL